jgi:glutaryl-CoA dehydrogenase
MVRLHLLVGDVAGKDDDVVAPDSVSRPTLAFVLEKDNPGYKATKIEQKFSLRCVQNADIVLTDCRVSEEARLQKCESFADIAKVLMGTRNGVAWAAVGNATARRGSLIRGGGPRKSAR